MAISSFEKISISYIELKTILEADPQKSNHR